MKSVCFSVFTEGASPVEVTQLSPTPSKTLTYLMSYGSLHSEDFVFNEAMP